MSVFAATALVLGTLVILIALVASIICRDWRPGVIVLVAVTGATGLAFVATLAIVALAGDLDALLPTREEWKP